MWTLCKLLLKLLLVPVSVCVLLTDHAVIVESESGSSASPQTEFTGLSEGHEDCGQHVPGGFFSDSVRFKGMKGALCLYHH